MRRIHGTALLLLSQLLLCGCATLVYGPNEELLVQTAPEGALVELSDGRQRRAPALFPVRRRSEIEVLVSLDGHASRQITVEHRESRYGGLLVIGTFFATLPVAPFNFLIALADNMSGAVFELSPNPIDAELRPLDGSPWPRLPQPSGQVLAWKTSCEEPYALERDCSYWSRAGREVRVRGLYVRVSGSEDGSTLRVQPARVEFELREPPAVAPAPRASEPRRRTGPGRRFPMTRSPDSSPEPMEAAERSGPTPVVTRRAAGAAGSCERVHLHLALAGAQLQDFVVVVRDGQPDACYLLYDRDAYALLPPAEP